VVETVCGGGDAPGETGRSAGSPVRRVAADGAATRPDNVKRAAHFAMGGPLEWAGPDQQSGRLWHRHVSSKKLSGMATRQSCGF